MKLLTITAAALALMTSVVQAQDKWEIDTSKELCVAKNSEQLRSPMYKETPESEEIMQLERDSCWYVAKREIAKLGTETLDKNGLLFLDGGPILYGRDQQLAMFTEFLKDKNIFLTWEPVEAHVSESKDMAWAFGVYKFQMPGKEMEVGKYTSVWQKDANGKWGNVSEMRNPFKR